MERLRNLIGRLAAHGDSSATATLDRETAQLLDSLIGCAARFCDAAQDHIKPTKAGFFVDRNMSSIALHELGNFVGIFRKIDEHKIEPSEWHRQPTRNR